VARAQQQARSPARIGLLPLGSPANAYDRSLVEAFREGLRNVGLVENRDVALDVVWISGDPEQAVSELIRRGTDLLVPCGSSASVAARRTTLTIPILFISVGNPVGMGLVESLPRPGRNATGFSDVLADLSGKYVELARELSSSQAAVDYLWHNGWPDGLYRYHATREAAVSLGVRLRSREIGGVAELDDAIAAIKGDGGPTFIVQPSPFTYQQRTRIIDLATRHGLATIFAFPAAGREGSLVAYGPDYVHMYRNAATYADRILHGRKPADLPVQQPDKFELIINLKTATTLGLTVPSALLARADAVIE
jgi:putative ABC transport system substrate-binding protein